VGREGERETDREREKARDSEGGRGQMRKRERREKSLSRLCVCADMKRSLTATRQRSQNQNQMESAKTRIWTPIPQAFIAACINSMDRRYNAVMNAQGGPIPYLLDEFEPRFERENERVRECV